MTPIIYHKRFLKVYKKLPEYIKQKFLDRVDIFQENPKHPLLDNHSVGNIYPNWRSIDITGDFRALFELQNGE